MPKSLHPCSESQKILGTFQHPSIIPELEDLICLEVQPRQKKFLGNFSSNEKNSYGAFPFFSPVKNRLRFFEPVWPDLIESCLSGDFKLLGLLEEIWPLVNAMLDLKDTNKLRLVCVLSNSHGSNTWPIVHCFWWVFGLWTIVYRSVIQSFPGLLIG